MQTSTSPQNQRTNVVGPVDFTTITRLRASIKEAKARWVDDYRFQKGIEKEEDLLKYFMSKI